MKKEEWKQRQREAQQASKEKKKQRQEEEERLKKKKLTAPETAALDKAREMLNSYKWNPRRAGMRIDDLQLLVDPESKLPEPWHDFLKTLAIKGDLVLYTDAQGKERVCLPDVKKVEDRDAKLRVAEARWLPLLYTLVQGRGHVALSEFIEQNGRKEPLQVYTAQAVWLIIRRERCFTLEKFDDSDDYIVKLKDGQSAPPAFMKEHLAKKALQKQRKPLKPRVFKVSLFNLKKLAQRERKRR
eukprot:EG_transcript_23608